MKQIDSKLAVAVYVVGFLYSAGVAAQVTDTPKLPDGPGKAVLEKHCSSCHGPEVVFGRTGSLKTWNRTIDVMVARGATGTDEELDQIAAYLTKYFGVAPTAKNVNVNQADSSELQAALGISASEADAIVAYRAANGSFKVWEDLLKVAGLDTTKLSDKKSLILF